MYNSNQYSITPLFSEDKNLQFKLVNPIQQFNSGFRRPIENTSGSSHLVITPSPDETQVEKGAQSNLKDHLQLYRSDTVESPSNI